MSQRRACRLVDVARSTIRYRSRRGDDESLRTRLRHYTNLSAMAGRVRRLLAEFAWDRMDRVFPIAGGRPA